MTAHPAPESSGIGLPHGRPTPAATGYVDIVAGTSISARLTAHLRQGRLDRKLATGGHPIPGSALAIHARRITSFPEREAIARSLRRAVDERCDSRPLFPKGTVPIHRDNVAAAEPLIDALTLRLHTASPVAARGMARLRLVLSDGAGPLYAHGRGDLTGRLGAALAAL